MANKISTKVVLWATLGNLGASYLAHVNQAGWLQGQLIGLVGSVAGAALGHAYDAVDKEQQLIKTNKRRR